MTEQELQDLQKMVEIAVSALEDVKAKDIAFWKPKTKPPCLPAMIIASGVQQQAGQSFGQQRGSRFERGGF